MNINLSLESKLFAPIVDLSPFMTSKYIFLTFFIIISSRLIFTTMIELQETDRDDLFALHALALIVCVFIFSSGLLGALLLFIYCQGRRSLYENYATALLALAILPAAFLQ